jgi:hypothetical protein
MHVLSWIGLGDEIRRRRQIECLSAVMRQLASKCRRIEHSLEATELPAQRRRMQVRLEVARRQYRKGLRQLHDLQRSD